MEDIRLKEIEYNYGGKTYLLRANFNVYAEITESLNEIPDLLQTPTKLLKFFPTFLAAMMNDYASQQNWPERFTGEELGRELDFRELIVGNNSLLRDTLSLLRSGLYLPKEEMESEKETEPKN